MEKVIDEKKIKYKQLLDAHDHYIKENERALAYANWCLKRADKMKSDAENFLQENGPFE